VQGERREERGRPTRRGALRWPQGALVLLLLVGSGVVGYLWPADPRVAVRTLLDPVVAARVEAFAPEIRAAAAESGLDPCLVAGIVHAESSGDPRAVSKAGALGLMQLLPPAAEDAARRLGLPTPDREELLARPDLNLRLGASHFAWTLAAEGGDPERALVAYNAGRTKLRRWIREAGSYEAWLAARRRAGDSPTLAYADRVLARAEAYRERGLLAAETAPGQP
jgi:soluble lytic murein transglycosylase-like protein